MRKYIADWHFDELFKILSNPRFAAKEGLGGEMPFFIHSFPIIIAPQIERSISSLIKRLGGVNIEVLDLDLYQMCLELLKEKGLFEQIITQEQKTPKSRLMRILAGPLNIDTVIMPAIERMLHESTAKLIFLTGIGAVYPFLRSHTVLNNLQTIIADKPVIMFFPGDYNNQSLTLFGLLKDDNYYRAHNLNEYV